MRCRGLLTKSTPPTRAARHHWSFSSRRTPSTGSSLREFGEYVRSSDQSSTRASSDAKSRDPQGSPFLEPCRARTRNGSGRGLLPAFSPLSPPMADCAQDTQPFVLSPCICITSEPTTPEHGPQAMWAAIEVSGRLSRIPSSRSPSKSSSESRSMTGSFINPQLGYCSMSDTCLEVVLTSKTDRFFEFGCLYNLTVDVLPASGTTVVQVLQEQAFPTTIYAGSSVFLLAKIQMDPEKARRRSGNGHVRQKSDELMEDLELQLGSSVVGYMHIRVSYSHSAFPEYSSAEADTVGVSSLRSRLETTATATLKPHNALSLWSPRPETSQSHLLQLIERHWGADQAMSVKDQIIGLQQPPKKLEMTCPKYIPGIGSITEKQTTPRPVTPQVHVPVRQASLQNDVAPKASTLGKALGKKTQSLFSPGQSSTPRSRRSRNDSSGSGPQGPWEEHNLWPETGSVGSVVGSLRDRPLRGLTPARTEWSAAATEGTTEARQDDAVRVTAKKDTGLWNWGIWF
ncbi:Uncharacterized protein TCAP_00706 [Tolypocladium capitatum]|uniref:Uncharacterized protein n=1 Tax=Tolypocladium capitatum TaxID=45235 RepID=A0A2K3QPD1_9HYPO|nr:Uncharacterized protein TCAP_00706 [Tolypocladium capitatum]